MTSQVCSQTALSRLTILIPTYNRPERLRRALAYWGGLGQKTIVMDGSAEPLPVEVQHTIPVSVTYLHRPVLMAKRLEEAILSATTPYVALCSDDEFHLPTGLVASVRALDADPGLVAAMGRCMGFSVGARGNVQAFLRYPEMHQVQVSQDSSRDRIQNQMQFYAPRSIYAVVRREVWHAAMHPIMRREFPVYATGELQFEMLVALSGRTRILPVLHWLRSHEVVATEHAGSDTNLSRKVTIADRWGDAEFRAEFCTETALAYCSIAGGEVAEVEALVEEGLDTYVHGFIPKIRAKGLSAWVRHRMSRLRRPLAAVCRQLEGQGVKINQDDLKRALGMVGKI